MINWIPISTRDNIIPKQLILKGKQIMQWLFTNLLLILLPLLIPSHIILLNLLNELHFGVIPIHDELLMIGLGVQDAVDVLEGDLEVLVFEEFLLRLGWKSDGVVEGGLEELLLLGLDFLLLLFELELELGGFYSLSVAGL